MTHQTGNKDFMATAMLSLFVGWLGVDRFYLGKVGTGLLKLLTFGGCGIWYLIDLILVLTGAQTDKNGLALKDRKKNLKTALIITGAILGFGLFVSVIGQATNNNLPNTPPPSTSQPDSTNQAQPTAISVPKYEIKETKDSVGVTELDEYYVLTDPVNLENDSFKQSIKAIFTDIATKRKTVNFMAKVYTDLNILNNEAHGQPLSDNIEENVRKAKESAKIRETTLLASYTGGFNYDTLKPSSEEVAYNILWFGAANSSNPVVGKYVGDEQWKPSI